jgi:hypothetical protein
LTARARQRSAFPKHSDRGLVRISGGTQARARGDGGDSDLRARKIVHSSS